VSTNRNKFGGSSPIAQLSEKSEITSLLFFRGTFN